MSVHTYVTHSEEETARLARGLAADLRAPAMIALRGDLGAGKSVFARALIRALCGEAEMPVPSPTFTLVQVYESPYGPVHHFDLYRLAGPEDVVALDWDGALSSGIVIAEWPERLGALLPRRRLDVAMRQGAAPDERVITIEKTGLTR